MTIYIALLGLLVLAALLTVVTADLLKAAIGLAVTSVILAILMFQLQSPLAAVFELSVCAGLITVIFVSTISLTNTPADQAQEQAESKNHFLRYIWLPVLLLAVGAVLFYVVHVQLPSLPKPVDTEVKSVLWNARQLDLLGQILIILVGVFGIVVLFKEKSKNE